MLQFVLDYFSKLVQGENILHLRKWIKGNEDILKECFNRSQFLRIKFNPFDEIPKILKENNIEFKINDKTWKKEILYYEFDESVLDTNGALDFSKITNSVKYLEYYLSGEIIKAKELFKIHLIKNQPEEFDDCISETLCDDLSLASVIKEHYFDLAYFIVTEMKSFFESRNMLINEIEDLHKELLLIKKINL